MPNIWLVVLVFGAALAMTAGLLGHAYSRIRVLERAAERARIDALVADAEKRITATVMEKAFGMMRNIVTTKDAEPDVAHPIAERKLAETYLFDLAQGRKTREMIDRELNGKGDAK